MKSDKFDFLDFEILVMDMVADRDIKNPDQLRDFSDQLHQSLELAIEDYAFDMGMDNYEPVY